MKKPSPGVTRDWEYPCIAFDQFSYRNSVSAKNDQVQFICVLSSDIKWTIQSEFFCSLQIAF